MFLIATISFNSTTAYAHGGTNMTEDVSKLTPNGSATCIMAQGEKFQGIEQCQTLVGQPTVAAVRTTQ